MAAVTLGIGSDLAAQALSILVSAIMPPAPGYNRRWIDVDNVVDAAGRSDQQMPILISIPS